MNDAIDKIEALLFSSGRSMSIKELCKICKEIPENIISALQELRNRYEEKKSSLMVVDEGNKWKLSVREEYTPLVRSIVTETELTRAVMETLAVISFMYPVLQSEVVKIRSNMAYEHLNELEELGYITRSKHGRTYKITLTQKFFGYFELSPEKLKESFKGFEEVVRVIENKESEKQE